jgi:hypothetical protein
MASSPNPETVDRLTQQLGWFLAHFHEEHQKTGTRREAEFCHGNFAGMKRRCICHMAKP